MGWTQFTMHEPIKEWFKKQWETSGSDYEVLDSALVKRTTLYGAIKQKSTGEVFCAVYYIQWSNTYHYNFSYKDMTEHSGPGASECPEKIFKLLTPLNDENDPNGWGRQWRERVQQLYDSRKKLNKGYILKTDKEIEFQSGFSYQYFVRHNRRLYVAHNHTGDGTFVKTSIRVNFNPFYQKHTFIEEKFGEDI